MRHISAVIISLALLSILCVRAYAQQSAPTEPGYDAQWATAAKQAIGTSASLESKVWFTLAQGVMTEVYYPNVTVANVQVLQFFVLDPKTNNVETERDDAIHQIRPLRIDSLSFQQINTGKSGKWQITKMYATDPKRASVLIDVRFERSDPNLQLYVYFDPSIGNTGMGDRGTMLNLRAVDLNGFEAFDKRTDFRAMLLFTVPISEAGTAFAVESVQKLIDKKSTLMRNEVGPGNIVQTARINEPSRFTVALAFDRRQGGIPDPALAENTKRFNTVLTEYERGWSDYVKTLPKVGSKYQAQFNMAAMVLKAQEDKTVRGANVASLTIPWGGGANANEDVGGGYHLVWARDLYHVFTAYLAIGDKAAAGRALDFLFNIQQKADGSFPQNSWLDGKGGWGSLQMDEVGYPLIMAWQLGRFDKKTYEQHVKRAADFIVKNGPKTLQERWEEESGYSPSTIAAEIAGLVCAADIAKRNGDSASAKIYLDTADNWQANIEKWTATTTGKYGDGNYYLRLTQNGRPDSGDKIELNNSAGTFDEREIVDAGFLELVRRYR